ncbi:plastocyanin/azurin family copper-binding protein, partial [Arthrospira platensis SPKY1]|nr:plastocyanin/azurin family copper-binding protein [Arthrospira platensis SPKY1]
MHVSIIGNSYYPKVIQIAPGTKVTWTNEDAFTYMAGEYSGIHNAAGTSAHPDEEDGFVTPLLAHAESYSHVFEYEWEYEYICTPHPYMRGKVIVKEPDYAL